MSDRQQENASRIALYLDNKLSPEEREAFKQALREDDELRIQYVDALTNRAGTGITAWPSMEPLIATERPEDAEGPSDDTFEKEMGITNDTGVAEVGGLEEADSGADVGESADLAEPYREVPAGGGFFGSAWMVGMAALLLIIAGVAIGIMISRGGLWNRTRADGGYAAKGTGVDSAAGSAVNRRAQAGKAVDSAGSGAGGATALPDNVYARLYKPYMRGNDPVEVREYYQDYRTGNYAAILTAGDSAVMRPLPRGLLVRNYMRLYVGLSYLATGDGRNAVSELGDVVFRTKPGDVLYETAEWYLALAWLKRNDVYAAEARNKALGMAREIAHGYSRYREPAIQLVRVLEQ